MIVQALALVAIKFGISLARKVFRGLYSVRNIVEETFALFVVRFSLGLGLALVVLAKPLLLFLLGFFILLLLLFPL